MLLMPTEGQIVDWAVIPVLARVPQISFAIHVLRREPGRYSSHRV
jgi:hypothetical protein